MEDTCWLSRLEWKPWPKDPTWFYADVAGVLRISTTNGSGHYWIRGLEEDGTLSSWHFMGVEKDEAKAFLTKALPSALLKKMLADE
jgi:hypothetical protein